MKGVAYLTEKAATRGFFGASLMTAGSYVGKGSTFLLTFLLMDAGLAPANVAPVPENSIQGEANRLRNQVIAAMLVFFMKANMPLPPVDVATPPPPSPAVSTGVGAVRGD